MQIDLPSFQNILNTLQQYVVPIAITITIVIVLYTIVSKILSRVRSRGIISRGAEEAIKLALLAVLAIVVVPIALSSWFQLLPVAITFITILLLIAGFILYSIRTYIENTISYILFVSSKVVKDGEFVKINILNEVYEGRISIAEGGYAIIDSDDKKVFIPYSLLMKSIIMKTLRNKAKFKLIIRGQSLELTKVVNEVRDLISNELKIINRESIDIKPSIVKDDEIVLRISVEVPNPRNVEECYITLTKLLTWRLPYKFSIEFE